MFAAILKICAVVLCLVQLQHILAQVSLGPADDSRYPGKCYYEGMVFDVNETLHNPFKGQCCRVSCSLWSEDKPLKTQYYLECCDLAYIAEGCRGVDSLAFAFPDCCTEQVCPGDEV